MTTSATTPVPTTGQQFNDRDVPKLCPRCNRGLGQTDWCAVCRECQEAMERAQSAAEPVKTPADRSGTLVDSGFRVGERLLMLTARGAEPVMVLGPTDQPHEYLTWGGSGWERRFAFAPQLRVVREGEPETRWLDVPLRLLSRPESAVAS